MWLKTIRPVVVGLFTMALLGTALPPAAAVVADSRESRNEVRQVMKDAKNKTHQAQRGAIVYKTYCVLCHGNDGKGGSRMTKLHGSLQLEITKQSPDYYERIIREGGAAVGRSKFMPTWGDEFSDEQINDVVAYLSLITDPVKRGEVVFRTNCILCHGVKGDGNGRAAELYDPPPADLTRSDKNDQYKRMIITMGGAAMGRSAVMPVWGEQLEPAEIDDVVAYLRTILVVPMPE